MAQFDLLCALETSGLSVQDCWWAVPLKVNTVSETCVRPSGFGTALVVDEDMRERA